VPRGQRDGSLWPYSRVSRPEPLRFLPSSSSVVVTRLSGPRVLSYYSYADRYVAHFSLSRLGLRTRIGLLPSPSKVMKLTALGSESG
jgi:hypothetical protein